MDWVQYLAGKGYTGRRATGAEVVYPCFFDCNEPSDSRKRKLYVNADTGLYSCKVCVCEGNHVTLQRHFGDEPERESTYTPPPPRGFVVVHENDPQNRNPESPRPTTGRRSDVLIATTELGEKNLLASDYALNYLLGPRRHLAPETVVNRRLGWAPAGGLTPDLPGFTEEDYQSAGLLAESRDQPGCYEYYRSRILIPYVVDGRIVQVRGKDIEGRYYTPVGDAVYLYNVDSLAGATEVVIVEGEFDCMMLADLLATSQDERIRKMAVVGLAGTGAIPEDFQVRLQHVRRAFIATDPDVPGRKASAKVKELLGSRGHEVEWPEDLVTSWVADGNELKDLDWTTWIGSIGITVDAVAHLFSIPGRLKSAMQALIAYRNQPTSGIKTGFTGLDAAFLPGLLPGQVMVALAKTGVGKTVFLCNLAYNLRHKRVLYITLEMTAEEIWVRIARIHRFYEPWASDETIARTYGNLEICDANRLNETDFALLVEEYEERQGVKPDVVFVDYLGYFARGRQGGSQYEKTTDAIMQLKAEAKRHKVCVITPAQVNRGAQDGKPIDVDDARDSGAIEETADLLIALWRSDDALDLNYGGTPTGKLHLKILKSRHGNKDRVFLLQMGLMSLVVVDDTSTLALRAARETNAVFRGDTYETWLANIRNQEQEISHVR